MGAQSSKGDLNDNPFAWCFGSSRKSCSHHLNNPSQSSHSNLLGDKELKLERFDDSVSLEDSMEQMSGIKGEQTLIIETQFGEMAKLDKLLCQGAITEDDYAPKLKHIATIQEEAMEIKRSRGVNFPYKV